MSHEIQLSNTNLPLQPALTPPQVLATTAQPEQTPLRRIHRLLRGRYALAAVLATIGAAAGAAAGIMLPKPAYQSVGVVQLHPILPGPIDDKLIPLYNQVIQNAMVQLQTERNIRQAMQSPQWKQFRPYSGDFPPADQVQEFAKNLTVKLMPNANEMIQIIYTDSRPDGKNVVQPAVAALIDAYKETWESNDANQAGKRTEWFTSENRRKDLEIEALRRQIDSLTHEIGDQATPVLVSREDSVVRLEAQLRDAERLLTNANEDRARRQAGTQGSTDFSAEDIARYDAHVAGLLNAVTDAETNLELVSTKMGPRSDSYIAAKRILDARQKKLADATRDFNEKFFIQNRPDGSGMVVVPKDQTTIQNAIAHLKADIEENKKVIAGINDRHTKIEAFKQQIDRLQGEIVANQRILTTLQFQKDMGGQFLVVEPGSIPQPAGDRRPVFAALGFVGGAAVPIGFLLLLGLANPRYRFSDETNTETIGLNLLGILPDLPDRLSDPEQASIAAHCVHQIRTMLQISGGTEERRVFAVTSAAPGDGKTSLTLALGLSYAACGTRTLLIDCDLVGAGLTSRMNVNAPEGVLEAIANRSLLEYVRTTDVADVAILPVGSAQTMHASTLSPAALRRLIDEARKQFDTILIDTGPILGSIEASLVCAAADAVVLTVARGQQRPLVEKSINHLMNIGAKLAGVVFNRAQSNDFDRSISGVSSLRSVASGNGHNGHDGPRYGTLGRAVHSATRQSDINEG